MKLRKEKPGCMIVEYDFSQEFMEIECTPKTRGTTFPLKKNLKHLTNILASITEDWQYLLTQKKTFYHSANQMLYPVITGHL